jgi:hypothetical protein
MLQNFYTFIIQNKSLDCENAGGTDHHPCLLSGGGHGGSNHTTKGLPPYLNDGYVRPPDDAHHFVAMLMSCHVIEYVYMNDVCIVDVDLLVRIIYIYIYIYIYI